MYMNISSRNDSMFQLNLQNQTTHVIHHPAGPEQFVGLEVPAHLVNASQDFAVILTPAADRNVWRIRTAHHHELAYARTVAIHVSEAAESEQIVKQSIIYHSVLVRLAPKETLS